MQLPLEIDTDRFLEIPPTGARLAYGVRGAQGSPVLLLMGFAMPGRAWVHQVGPLATAHRVAFYDHRGAGNTRAPTGAYSMALLAGDAARLLDHLGWDRAHVVGVSMGGMVAQHLALAHPERLRSLTLMVTHAGGLSMQPPTPRGLLRFVQVNLARSAGPRFEALEQLLFPADYLARCDRAWLRAVLERDHDASITKGQRLSQLAAVLRHDTRARLGELGRHPTLVVKAERDVLIRPRASDVLHRRIPGARLRVFPGAGHGVIRQCPAELNQSLLAHFARADARASELA